MEVTVPADAILVDVTVEGPAGAAELIYLWDTGALHTTLSRATAAEIGLEIPPDAPVLTLETAAGKRDAPIVVLSAIVIEGQRVEGISASICDACAEGRKSGLVGLNAMRAFESRLAGPTNTLELRPVNNAGAADRTSDIARFVEMDHRAHRAGCRSERAGQRRRRRGRHSLRHRAAPGPLAARL